MTFIHLVLSVDLNLLDNTSVARLTSKIMCLSPRREKKNGGNEFPFIRAACISLTRAKIHFLRLGFLSSQVKI